MPSNSSHPEPEQSVPERRDYYRINDRIGLELNKLPSADIGLNDAFGSDQFDVLKTEFRRLDLEVRSQLTVLAERDRALAGLIKSLNGKLDTLERIMACVQNPLQPEDWQEVTLSEGGLAFSTATPVWQPGDNLAIQMTLSTHLYQPRAIAEVLETVPDQAGGTRVHVHFSQITDGDRQQIARHVMRWQIQQRQND
ncbi:PilZ domain-containing protein [Marinobacter salinisoli]|uniref:PilZ domain-containing protein n=1 Tax=Marinobacter salinisoli TaxID=2769486 RepID=A0ABX7MN00_9GAMM|nr:PilZ domain-containing protein [Marinobacter salinisoli]QSP93612.1 PilZ domain-containing protein [Marinobacter salinisoli]